jgi:hypothetical protein
MPHAFASPQIVGLALARARGSVAVVREHAHKDAAFEQLGYSGCSLALRSDGARVWFEKAAPEPYGARLELQMVRQARARARNRLAFVRIPELHDCGWEHPHAGPRRYVARMQYLPMLDCVQLFAQAGPAQVERVADMLLAYLEANFAAATELEVGCDRFTAKLDQIAAALAQAGALEPYRCALDGVRRRLHAGLRLPIGPTHGDLTLANVMSDRNATELGLLDFLDGYLDSPVVDVAKLRQDTRFHWIACLYEGPQPVDHARLAVAFAYLDRRILECFAGRAWMRELELLEAINLLRIAPYAIATGPRADRVRALILRALATLGY